jgi:hypothetical protein
MLIDMKARVEGIRALAIKLAHHQDQAALLAGQDDEAAAFHAGQVDLLVPLVKAYATDQGFRICETAIQTCGGAGYTRDYPVEQYCRDSKCSRSTRGPTTSRRSTWWAASSPSRAARTSAPS